MNLFIIMGHIRFASEMVVFSFPFTSLSLMALRVSESWLACAYFAQFTASLQFVIDLRVEVLHDGSCLISISIKEYYAEL